MFGLSKVDKVKRHYDLLDTIRSKGVQLKKSGGSYIGLCPFHDDSNPSLRVTPEKGLFNCPACGIGGDIITFHEKYEKVSNKQAINDLYLGIDEPGTIKSPDHSSPAQIQESSLLKDVSRLYHKNFTANKAAQEYLIQRGISNKEIWGRFHLGYSDGGSLKNAVSSQLKIAEQLKELGLLNEKGNESFYKCLIVPIQDGREVCGLYGRSIEGHRQMYLKGKRRGVFNGQAAKHSDSIIITESILDALSLIQIGFSNVIPIYGTNGFTDDHRKYLREQGFNEIVFCLDNDALLRTRLEQRPLNKSPSSRTS
ncbi:MAG: toprim domain-containing protein [Planctomycetes bacterium]|nr:toprim domain-containing protein [Planctomycetota bacterium]